LQTVNYSQQWEHLDFKSGLRCKGKPIDFKTFASKVIKIISTAQELDHQIYTDAEFFSHLIQQATAQPPCRLIHENYNSSQSENSTQYGESSSHFPQRARTACDH